jgi:hypothetical protein
MLFFHPAIFIDQAGFVKPFKNLLYGVLSIYPIYRAGQVFLVL